MAYAHGGGLNGSTGWANAANSSGRWSAAGGSGGWSSVQQSGTNLVIGYGGGGGSFNYDNDWGYPKYGGGAGGGSYSGVTSWNGNSPGTSNGARSGNGYAKITLVEEIAYYIDLNGKINGTQYGNTSPAGKADVYINGTKVNTGVTDFYTKYPDGTTFRMVATANPGYQLVSSSTCSGTVNGGNTGCNFEFKTQHTVTINKNNGTAPIKVTVLYGETYTLPSKPIKQGYTFVE